VVDIRSPNVVRGLRLTAEAATANFLLAGKRRGDRKRIRLDGEEVAWKEAKPAANNLTPGDWLKAFFMSLICREQKLMDSLCRVSCDELRQFNEEDTEYRLLLVDGLRQTWLGSVPSEILLAAMEATDPKRKDVRDRMTVARVAAIDVPVIRLVYYIATADPDFGKVHAQAVVQHKKFWTSNARHKISWHGFLAMELTALAAWATAWKRGETTVQSEYVPEYLVNGDF
jgi:hypothetical protein